MVEEVRIATFSRRVSAELALVKLRMEGIPARMVDDSAMGENILGFHIFVAAASADSAGELLDEPELGPETSVLSSAAVSRARIVFRVTVFVIAILLAFFVVFVFASS